MIDSPTLNLRPAMRALHRGIDRTMHTLGNRGDTHPRVASAIDTGWRYLTELERMSLTSIAKRPATACRKLKHTVSELLGGSAASADRIGAKSPITSLAGDLGRQDRELSEIYTRLYRNYFPEKIDVPIVYFSASYGGGPVRSLSPTVEIVRVPGGHTGCITSKVEVLAGHLRERLERLSG
jgi:hypothetical protein